MKKQEIKIEIEFVNEVVDFSQFIDDILDFKEKVEENIGKT